MTNTHRPELTIPEAELLISAAKQEIKALTRDDREHEDPQIATLKSAIKKLSEPKKRTPDNSASHADLVKSVELARDFLASLPPGWLSKTNGDIGLLNDFYVSLTKVLPPKKAGEK